MITATTIGKNGIRICVLGVTRENIAWLTSGHPIFVRAETHPGFPEDVAVAIVYGETEADLRRELEPMIGPETKIVIVPRDKGRPQ